MKTHATQTVKDKSDERKQANQEDDVEHLFRCYLEEPEFEGSLRDPDLQAAVSSACRRGLERYRLSPYATSEELEEELIKRHGAQLNRHDRHGSRISLETIVHNFLVNSSKEKVMIQDECNHEHS